MSETEEALFVLVKLIQDDPDAVVVLGKRKASDPDGEVTFIDLRVLINESNGENANSEEEFTIDLIFFQTGEMRRTFEKYPEVLLIDSTYNVTINKMPLSVTMVMDGYGSGRPTSYCFVADEKTDTLIAALRCLKMYNESAAAKVRVITVDKDPGEIAAILAVFVSVLIIICEFHTLQALRRATKDIPDKTVKNETREVLQGLVYAESEEKFEEHLIKLRQAAPPEIMKYMEENWLHNKQAWVRYQRLAVPHLGNPTNNRLERHNGYIKCFTDKDSSMAESIKALLEAESCKNDRVSHAQFESVCKTAYVTNCEDPVITEIMNTFTPFAASLLRGELSSMGPNTRASADDTCDCAIFKGYNLPCQHILKRRQEAGENLIGEVAARWLIYKSNPPMTSEQETVQSPDYPMIPDIPGRPRPKTKREKFKAALSIGTQLADTISDCGSQQSATRIQVLRDLMGIWAAGSEAVVTEAKSSSPVEEISVSPDIDSISTVRNFGLDKESISASSNSSPVEGISVSPDIDSFSTVRNNEESVPASHSASDIPVDNASKSTADSNESSQRIADVLRKLKAKNLSLRPKIRTKGRPRGGSLNVIGTTKHKKRNAEKQL